MNDEKKYDIIKQISELSTRATGRSTRLIDEYIQKLFENRGQWIKIYDHYESKQAHNILANKIIKRIQNEHPGTVYDCNKKTCEIKIIECARDYVNEMEDQLIRELKEYE